MTNTSASPNSKKRTTRLVLTAMLGAMAAVLMFISVNVPLMPSFIKLDVSELPALLASFSMGPLYGIAVCLIKNLVNLPFTTTGGVGELANLLLGICFVLPAGLIYKKMQKKSGAVIGAFIGAACMALASILINYFIVYPVYANFMPMTAIINAYQLINPNVNTLLDCLITFNMPFTFIKGVIDVGITFLIYLPLEPIIRGKVR